MRAQGRFWIKACCALLVSVFAAPALAQSAPAAPLAKLKPVTGAMLEKPAKEDWLQWGRTYDGQNFSPLKRITRSNVTKLTPAWNVPLEKGRAMPTPLVHDGVMFLQVSPDTVLALDATTGAELWRHKHPLPETVDSTMKMGLSLAGGRVFVPTSDLHVLALDAKTGEKVWDHAIELYPPQKMERTLGLRSAPLIVGDKVIQGVTTSFVPGGGFIVGLDINTGKEVWRFNTIPRPGEPGGETWNGLPLEGRKGGSVWHQGTWDKDLNLIYYGVAPTYDTAPLIKAPTIPGTTNTALYTNSTIALNPDTGKLVWHYQHFENDQWDLDWVFERTLATLKVNGKNRRVVMTAGKMAILEVLDAKTGEYLFSVDAGVQNIITAIHPVTGKKTIDPAKLPDPTRPTMFCPSPNGARSWPPTSVSSSTGMLYMPITESCMSMSGTGGGLLTAPGSMMGQAVHPDAARDGKIGRLQAMDLKGRKKAWNLDLETPITTSILTTAGGVLFAADLEPKLKAYDDRNGKLLWSAPLEAYPSSSIITYGVGKTQYVALVVGVDNNHISGITREYRNAANARGVKIEPPTAGPSVVVFKLP